jgi:hypothetical protein
MILRFKLFENLSTAQNLLLDQLGDAFITKYFKDNYPIDEDNLSTICDIWQYVDDDRFVNDWINDHVSNSSIEELDEEDYQSYIKKYLLDDDDVINYLKKKAKKEKILGYKELSIEDLFDELDLNRESLIEIIKDQELEEDCIRKYYEDLYERDSAKDILSEIYSETDLAENGYKYVENYVDDRQVIDDFFRNASYEDERYFVLKMIAQEKKLQKKLLDMDSENSVLLFDEIDEFSMGSTYRFQNSYLKTIKNQEGSDMRIEEYIKKLNDKFELNPRIKIKYKDYLYYLDIEKYNL